MKKKKVIMSVIAVIALMIITFIGYLVTYSNPADKALEKAGIVEKQVQVNRVKFNYAEGPDNGPALILLHAQLLDWYTYCEVLPELSTKFHVFAIDYPGHGKTIVPEEYVMSANNIGKDLGCFIDEVVGEEVFVTGNSSGGLLTTWLAANRPDIVKAVVLEDPPLFSAEYPEVKSTVANKAFTQSKRALESEFDGDFLMYWIKNSSQFFDTYVFKGSDKIIEGMVFLRRTFNPNNALAIPFMPVSVQETLRGLDKYNPKFGAAFYDGSWNEGFDHAQALADIECPVCLIQADFDYLEDGTLNGAMSQEMADYAMELLKDGTYVRLESGHVTNLEVPEEFITVLEDFFLNE